MWPPSSRVWRWTLRARTWGCAVCALALAMNAVACPGVPLEAAQALQTLVRASFDWDHHVEIQSGENSAAGGETYYSDVSHLGRIWLLRQRTDGSEWHRFGMVVPERPGVLRQPGRPGETARRRMRGVSSQWSARAPRRAAGGHGDRPDRDEHVHQEDRFGTWPLHAVRAGAEEIDTPPRSRAVHGLSRWGITARG